MTFALAGVVCWHFLILISFFSNCVLVYGSCMCSAVVLYVVLSSSSSFYLNQATWPIHKHTKTYRQVTRSSAIAEWPRDASCQLKSCHLPRNSAETTCTTSPEQIEVMKLKHYSKTMCNKHVHSTMTRSCRFHFPIVSSVYQHLIIYSIYMSRYSFV